MKRIIVTLMLCVAIKLHAQQLTIGSVLQDIHFENVLNYSSEVTTLSSFKEKKPALILFFVSSCSVCKQAISIADSMQKSYPNALRVLLVTEEKTSAIKELFNETPLFKGIDLPIVTENKALRKLFPHLSVPHLIWLSKESKIEAITSGKELTAGNVQLLMAGSSLPLPVKKEPGTMGHFLAADPLMVYDYTEHRNKMIHYSYFSGYRPDFGSGSTATAQYYGLTRLKATNYSLVSLFAHAYAEMYRMHPTQLFFRDSSRHKPDPGAKKGYYCYDLIIKGTLDSARRIMRRDLQNFLGYTSRIEKRMITCYLLKRTSTIDKLAAKTTKRGSFEMEEGIAMQGLTIGGITDFYMHKFPFRIIDETGYPGRVDMVLPKDQTNIALVQQYLLRYDLELVKAERPFDVLIIE